VGVLGRVARKRAVLLDAVEMDEELYIGRELAWNARRLGFACCRYCVSEGCLEYKVNAGVHTERLCRCAVEEDGCLEYQWLKRTRLHV